MAYELGVAYLPILPETSKIAPGIKKALGDNSISREADSGGSRIGRGFRSSFTKAVGAAGGLGAAIFSAKTLGAGFDRLTTIEDATKSLTIQLGDAAKAGKLVEDITKVVTGTPFALDQFVDVGQNLAAFGVAAEDIPRYLTAIGDAAATKGKRAPEMVSRLGEALGQAAADGRLMSDTLNRFTEAGIPAAEILAKKFDMDKGDVRLLASKGKLVGPEYMDAIIEGIQDSQGGLAKSLGNTLSGSLANAKISFTRAAANIIKPFSGQLTSAFNSTGANVDAFGKRAAELATVAAPKVASAMRDVAAVLRDVYSVIKSVVSFAWEYKEVLAVLGAGLLVYKGYLVATKVAESSLALWRGRQLIAMYAVTVAQKAMNAAMRANPVGLVITVLTLLGAALTAAYKKSATFRGIIQGVLGFIKSNWKTIVSLIGGPIVAAIVHFDKLKSAAGKVRELFGSVVGGIGRSWDKLTGFVEKPIKAVIGVINRFIRAVNKIPGVNLPEISWGQGKGSSKNGVVRAQGRTAFATGGGVRGPGTGTSDSIPALLSNGEHVWTAREVVRAGGHAAVERLRAAARSGMHLPAFAAGGRVVPGKGKRHSGYPWASWAGDFPNPIGTPVHAWKSGVIALVRTLAGSYGKHIRMNHNDGTSSLYAHLSRFGKYGRGDKVGQGATIGYVGSTGNSTGPHLHFESMGGPYRGGAGGGSIWDKVTGSVGGLNSWFGKKMSSMLSGGGISGGLIGDVGKLLRTVGGQIRDGVKSKLFDSGGIAAGTGFMAKNTIAPERVLSPRQTRAYEQAVRNAAAPQADASRVARDELSRILRQGVSIDMRGPNPRLNFAGA